jgi:hypothetical protein
MTNVSGMPLSLPERDQDGFVLLSDLKLAARELEPEAFARAFPHPALVSVGLPTTPSLAPPPPAPERLQRSKSSTGISAKGDTKSRGSLKALRAYGGRVAILAKRPGNPFPNMISLGRALTNDVVLLLETVSKLQGFFTPGADGSWQFTDNGSTNGTLLDGVELEQRRPWPLADGSLLRFGLELEAEFILPRSLALRLRVD